MNDKLEEILTKEITKILNKKRTEERGIIKTIKDDIEKRLSQEVLTKIPVQNLVDHLKTTAEMCDLFSKVIEVNSPYDSIEIREEIGEKLMNRLKAAGDDTFNLSMFKEEGFKYIQRSLLLQIEEKIEFCKEMIAAFNEIHDEKTRAKYLGMSLAELEKIGAIAL